MKRVVAEHCQNAVAMLTWSVSWASIYSILTILLSGILYSHLILKQYICLQIWDCILKCKQFIVATCQENLLPNLFDR